MKSLLFTASISAFLVAFGAGCARSSPSEPPEPPSPTLQTRYIMPAIQEPVGSERRGAAIISAHKQHQMFYRDYARSELVEQALNGVDPAEVPLTLDHYSVEALDEYCRGGRNISQHHFKAIAVADLGAFADLYDFSTCVPPRYSYLQYVESFSAFCDGEERGATRFDLEVVNYFGGIENYPESLFDECPAQRHLSARR